MGLQLRNCTGKLLEWNYHGGCLRQASGASLLPALLRRSYSSRQVYTS